ncbi:hypothetical protein [Flavicella sediminum]|uniref:hypothetical protein n=1 Tax=Flavicella sediminum TaxID=2585141 RepID=UPI0011231520|nr:hypothetical protein [Flavicella sediminum]
MKNYSIAIVAFIFTLFSAQASNTKASNHSPNSPITFQEQGIEFRVHQNGTFDFRFDTRINNNTRNHHHYTNPHNVVLKDYRGRITQVGRVGIHYDRYGRLTAIGDIPIRFNNRILIAVGGLQINYSSHGPARYIGNVCDRNYNTRYIKPVIVKHPTYKHSNPKHSKTKYKVLKKRKTSNATRSSRRL